MATPYFLSKSGNALTDWNTASVQEKATIKSLATDGPSDQIKKQAAPAIKNAE